jgi:hypothetical protein
MIERRKLLNIALDNVKDEGDKTLLSYYVNLLDKRIKKPKEDKYLLGIVDGLIFIYDDVIAKSKNQKVA